MTLLAALSVRAVADAAGTTTRAVYSLFGSKDGLLVQTLALTAARQRAWEQLVAKVGRLGSAGLLGDKPATNAAVEFIAMMDGLGSVELRGAVLRLLPEGDEERAWRNALDTVIRGWTA